MSNDLIERREVISVLKEVFKKYNIGFKNGQGGFADAVPSAIEAIPTAYDVGKVKEEFEMLDTYYDNDYFGSNRKPMFLKEDVYEIIKQMDIEIE